MLVCSALCRFVNIQIMSLNYKNKVVVVTGGSEGIGRALVEQLLSQGAMVATCARDHDRLYALQSAFPSSPLHTMVADISNENDCRRFIETTIKYFGGIDVLINNAGISMWALMKDSSIDLVKKIMDVNFWGAVYCTKYALDSIISRKGTIVGISSVAGYRGLPGRSGYAASKFAMQGWLESLKTELMHEDVHVMWVCPGFTVSKIRYNAITSEGKAHAVEPLTDDQMMSAGDCATHILNAIAKKKRTLLLTFEGKRIVWLNRLFPKWADKMVQKFYLKNGELVK